MKKRSELFSSKRAQVTLFIVVGIVLVAVVVGFYLILSKTGPEISKPSMTEPENYIEKCAKDAASDAIDIMLPQGGWISPKRFKTYNNNNVAYLCYTNEFYRTCKMQEPLYIRHLENEITEFITPKVQNCFESLKSELEDQHYAVEMGSMNITTELAKNTVKMNVERTFAMSKNDEKRRFEKFNAILNSPLYNLAIVGLEIANQEAKYCAFEYVGFMIFYPEFNINKKAVGSGLESSKIYTIQDRYTGKQLNVATRSCAIPAGF